MSPEELVRDISHLTSLPEVCVRVNGMIDAPNANAASIGEVVGHDPNLTAQLLRLVNSPYYGFSNHISTVSHAIALVGMDELRSLVLAAGAARAFARIPQQLVDVETFWHHSVYCGLVARVLGERSGSRNRERLFVAGLLHDVGRLVLYHHAPEVARKILEDAARAGRPPHETEREVLGFDHADVGAALLRSWNLPRSLSEPVGCHHDPLRAEQFPKEAQLLHLSNAIAATVEPGTKGEWHPERVDEAVEPSVWKLPGVNEASAREAITEANLQSFEVLQIIAPDSTLIY